MAWYTFVSASMLLYAIAFLKCKSIRENTIVFQKYKSSRKVYFRLVPNPVPNPVPISVPSIVFYGVWNLRTRKQLTEKTKWFFQKPKKPNGFPYLWGKFGLPRLHQADANLILPGITRIFPGITRIILGFFREELKREREQRKKKKKEKNQKKKE